MQKTLFTGKDFNEYAEIHHSCSCSDKCLSGLYLAYEIVDDLYCGLCRVIVNCGNIYAACIVYIYLGSRTLHYGTDDLAAGAYDITDLFRIYVNSDYLRCSR